MLKYHHTKLSHLQVNLTQNVQNKSQDKVVLVKCTHSLLLNVFLSKSDGNVILATYPWRTHDNDVVQPMKATWRHIVSRTTRKIQSCQMLYYYYCKARS